MHTNASSDDDDDDDDDDQYEDNDENMEYDDDDDNDNDDDGYEDNDDDERFTPDYVFDRAGNGDVEELKLALAHGNNAVDWWYDQNHSNALHFACERGHVECINVLLDVGANIESRNDDMCSPLHMSSFFGKSEAIRVLLDRAAPKIIINSKQRQGFTPLNFSCREGHLDCVRLLLDRNANIEEKNVEGVTPLHSASYNGYIDCINALLDRGALIDNLDIHGQTALYFAAKEGYIDCVDLLLEKGSNIDIMDNHGDTAVFVAAYNKQIECTRFLLNRQAAIHESLIDDIEHRGCRQMIRDEIQHRLKRAAFDSFINHHIEYPPHIHNIYSTCYPSGDLRVTTPAVGWDRALKVLNKSYFDEVFFYVHLHVANVRGNKTNIAEIERQRRCSNFQDFLAKNSDDTSTLMVILSDRLKIYLGASLV